MGSPWIKTMCEVCGNKFVVHKDWTDQSSTCDSCRMIEGGLHEAITLLLRTDHVKISDEIKEKILKIISKTELENRKAIESEENKIRSIARKSGPLNIDSSSDWDLIQLIDKKRRENNILCEQRMARELSKDRQIRAAIFKAISKNKKLERNLQKYDEVFKERNADREIKIAHRTRRLS